MPTNLVIAISGVLLLLGAWNIGMSQAYRYQRNTVLGRIFGWACLLGGILMIQVVLFISKHPKP